MLLPRHNCLPIRWFRARTGVTCSPAQGATPVAHDSARSRAQPRQPGWPLGHLGCHLAHWPVATSACAAGRCAATLPGCQAATVRGPGGHCPASGDCVKWLASCGAQRENSAGNNAPRHALMGTAAGATTGAGRGRECCLFWIQGPGSRPRVAGFLGAAFDSREAQMVSGPTIRLPSCRGSSALGRSR
jgi:hypothetical protein